SAIAVSDPSSAGERIGNGPRDVYPYANGAWRSLVAHLLWEQGVAGSNPAAPMSETPEGQRTEAHGPPEEGTEDHGQIPTTCPPTPLMRHLGLMMAVLAA